MEYDYYYLTHPASWCSSALINLPTDDHSLEQAMTCTIGKLFQSIQSPFHRYQLKCCCVGLLRVPGFGLWFGFMFHPMWLSFTIWHGWKPTLSHESDWPLFGWLRGSDCVTRRDFRIRAVVVTWWRLQSRVSITCDRIWTFIDCDLEETMLVIDVTRPQN